MLTPWPTVETVAVELVPAAHRRGPLTDVSWVVVRRFPDRTMRLHLPDTDAERAAHPVDFGRGVATQFGAAFTEPPAWLWFARVETVWAAWDHRLCPLHNRLGCLAATCRDDDADITEQPVPTFTLSLREDAHV